MRRSKSDADWFDWIVLVGGAVAIVYILTRVVMGER